MTVRLTVAFEGESMEEVVAAVRQWLEGQPGEAKPTAESPEVRRERDVRDVVAAVKGRDSRRFVRELAEAAVRGEAVVLDDELRVRYAKPTGTTFAGIVGGPNKLARRIASRDLIIWDAGAGGYRMDPLDAHVVLEAWSTPAEETSGHGEPSREGEPRSRGSTSGARPPRRAEWP